VKGTVEGGTSRSPALHISLFSIGILLEVYYYPALATAVDGLMGGTDGPGSSIGYFRDFYVLPAGIALGLVAAVLLGLAAKRSRSVLHRAAVIVWIVNLIALVTSSVWYFHAIRAASNYRE